LAVANLVRNDFLPELSQKLQGDLARGELTINVRAEAAPEVLRDVLQGAVGKCIADHPPLATTWKHLEFFKPGKPQPTHRVTEQR
jgi:hypothetical protein